MVQFGERLLHPQGCEAGLWALVPTLLHDLHNGKQDLQHTVTNVKFYLVVKVACNMCSILFLFISIIRCHYYVSIEYVPCIYPFVSLCDYIIKCVCLCVCLNNCKFGNLWVLKLRGCYNLYWDFCSPGRIIARVCVCAYIVTVCHQMAYWMGMEPVVQTGPLLIYTHNLPHLLKAGI